MLFGVHCLFPNLRDLIWLKMDLPIPLGANPGALIYLLTKSFSLCSLPWPGWSNTLNTGPQIIEGGLPIERRRGPALPLGSGQGFSKRRAFLVQGGRYIGQLG